MQPLECGFSGPLKMAYTQVCDAFIASHENKVITKKCCWLI
jgi:hypothetical protein